jgi:hypothetical protein
MRYEKLTPVHFESNFKEILEKAFDIKIEKEDDVVVLADVHNKYKIYGIYYCPDDEDNFYILGVHNKYKVNLKQIAPFQYKEQYNKETKKILRPLGFTNYKYDWKKMLVGFKFYLKNMKYIGQDDKVMQVNWK